MRLNVLMFDRDTKRVFKNKNRVGNTIPSLNIDHKSRANDFSDDEKGLVNLIIDREVTTDVYILSAVSPGYGDVLTAIELIDEEQPVVLLGEKNYQGNLKNAHCIPGTNGHLQDHDVRRLNEILVQIQGIAVTRAEKRDKEIKEKEEAAAKKGLEPEKFYGNNGNVEILLRKDVQLEPEQLRRVYKNNKRERQRIETMLKWEAGTLNHIEDLTERYLAIADEEYMYGFATHLVTEDSMLREIHEQAIDVIENQLYRGENEILEREGEITDETIEYLIQETRTALFDYVMENPHLDFKGASESAKAIKISSIMTEAYNKEFDYNKRTISLENDLISENPDKISTDFDELESTSFYEVFEGRNEPDHARISNQETPLSLLIESEENNQERPFYTIVKEEGNYVTVMIGGPREEVQKLVQVDLETGKLLKVMNLSSDTPLKEGHVGEVDEWEHYTQPHWQQRDNKIGNRPYANFRGKKTRALVLQQLTKV